MKKAKAKERAATGTERSPVESVGTAAPNTVPAASFAALCAAATLSGMAALLNQIVWSRLLVLSLGSTIEAVAAVTSVFMGGLAIGSAAAPRLLCGRDSRGSRSLFARIEFALALSAIVLVLFLPRIETLRAVAGAGAAWIASLLLLAVPSTLMGTTLVVLVSCLQARGEKEDSRRSGVFFAANTFGAVVGVYASVLWLLPNLGLQGASLVAALLNAIAGLIARTLAGAVTPPAVPASAPADDAQPNAAHERVPGLILMATAIAGFVGLASEVAWTRAFVLIAGPTAYAFAFVLGAVVLGLALGALAASVFFVPAKRPALFFGLAQAGVALAALRVLHILAQSPIAYGEAVRKLAESPNDLLWFQAASALGLILPPTFFSGMLFPLGVRVLRHERDRALSVSRISAWNTTGAIAGSLISAFFLLERIGLEGTLKASVVLSALSSALVLASLSGPSRWLAAAVAAGCGTLFFRTPAFDKDLFAGGAYKYSAYDPSLAVEDVLRRGELVSYHEGRLANVSVKRVGGTHTLAIDGKVDATSGADMLTQRLLAHVPLLLHAAPKKSLVIGLGSGVTAGSAALHEPNAVTVVEILPEVVAAARTFFADANGKALSNPRVSAIIGDARTFVLRTQETFDVVISEPSNPWMAGVSPLFTREFFSRVRSRLAPGGVFCQWAHLYNMSQADLATLFASFRDVFPRGSVFLISEADVLLLGSERDEDLSLRRERVATAPSPVLADLDRSRVSQEALLAIPAVPLRDLGFMLDDAQRHTDMRPVLEFRAPRSIHAQTAAANRRRLLRGIASPQGESLVARLATLDAVDSTEWAYDLAREAVMAGSTDTRVLQSFVKNAVKLSRVSDAIDVLRPVSGQKPVAPRLHAMALAHWNISEPQEALVALQQAAAADATFAPTFHLAAEIQSSGGDLQVMRQLLMRAFAVNRRDPIALGLAAEAEFKDGRFEPALRLAEGATQFDARESRGLEIRALSLAQLGRKEDARRAFEQVIAASSDTASGRANFGVFELAEGHIEAALRLFKDAVDLDPNNRGAYQGLEETAAKLGRSDLQAFATRNLARLQK